MNVCIVNGKRYNIPEGSISVINNKVYCNGELVTDTVEFTSKNINIVIEGNVIGDVKTEMGDISIHGNCNNVQTTSGDIEISGNVHGNVKTTSGDVSCGDISGNVDTVSGDIKNRVKNVFKKIFI